MALPVEVSVTVVLLVVAILLLVFVALPVLEDTVLVGLLVLTLVSVEEST